ncbi:response regulator [Mucilaginibacter sp. SMC90]|uniref:hybrid sensor histidine kinase/response regulator transcription factor n=1 Tax=Mucilaginibacter sp. SMC90 TaxID=2929803 RepID=UPI001FB1D48C|nr:response regulator [Mucilaginibacter sp. SMC90]UOE46598.1 response regulator [Mucilaginibacter sp. SMC90]
MTIKNLYWLTRHIFIKVLFVFILLPCFITVARAQPYPYKFNYLTVDEALSHTDANYIAQDKQGYIWVATFFGLDRYDGYSVKKFYNSNVPLNNAFKNRLISLYPDDQGNIWLCTEGGLQCFNTRQEKYIDFSETAPQNTSFQKVIKPAGDFLYVYTGSQLKLFRVKGNIIEAQKLNVPAGIHVTDIVMDKNGILYLSGNMGIWQLDKDHVPQKLDINGLGTEELSHVFVDNRNNLIVSAKNKLFLVDKKGGKFATGRQFVCTGYSDIRGVVRSSHGDYWINVPSAVLRLDGNLNFIQTVNDKSSPHGLNSNSLGKIFIDRTDCLWICTFGGGVNYCDLNEKLFYTIQHNPEEANSLAGNHIRSVLANGDDIWIGTTANGLNRYNLKTQKFSYYNTYNSAIKLKSDAVTALMLDNERNLWIGSSIGIDILKPDGTIWKPAGSEKFPNHVIDCFAKDYYGNIWFGNHQDHLGVIWKDAQNHYQVKYYGEGYFIFADKNRPQLLVSTIHGLKRMIIDREGNVINSFSYNASFSKPNSLSSDYTYPIGKQNDSTYWIGTIGGGLNKLVLREKADSYTITTYAGNYGIFNDVESLEVDDAGNIWMGGNGLECFNPATGRLIRYDKNDGLQGNSFKVGASCKGADGRLYFGGIKGLNYFDPSQIKANGIAARPVFTDILINNQRPVYNDQDSGKNAIPQAIGYCNQLALSYLQNNFVIAFSSMHFANPLKCRYRYKLNGFDKDWKYTDGKNPTAAYSNLDYASYKFVVEATNNDGIWSEKNAGMTIVITPPWWRSFFAKLIYILLFLSGLVGIYIYQARWYRLKREMEVRAVNENKREEMHQQREELYQQQLMFFTNVSHEFRTPLTLILGPLESLIGQNKNPALDYSYQLMYRNAKRLMNLISELMNFKKVADSIVKLQVQPLMISQFCKNLTWEFQNLAISKSISFALNDYTEAEITAADGAPFDVQVLEKILFNLLNNSFKYTNAGGSVVFEVFFDISQFKPSFNTGFELLNKDHRAKKYVYFRVADTGIGISGDSITRIFDRYYRISKNHLGSGVGLALVKSLTQLHKGDIYVYSERYKGTEIIIGIPWGDENYVATEKAAGSVVEAQLEVIDNAMLIQLPDNEPAENQLQAKGSKHLLLVEDNEELRAFLKQALGKYYIVHEAEDGKEGFEIATEKVPDLIISDVMMPSMNGIELCKRLKEQFETSHIPFVILSAKDALDTKIEGMESGADFYFAKPLSIDLLLLTVSNIFEQAEKLKLRYTKNYLSEATELVHSEKDKEFFQKLINVIEDNIQDLNLDVDFLCRHLFISRTKLYQKIKGISDQSVGEFIRTIRLKRAIQIMTHEDVSMNEVADRIGLQSSSNFSRAFKKEYGKSPLQFMQSLKKA